MNTLHIDADALGLDFDACRKLAEAVAGHLLGENMLLSFYDRERDLESPGGVSECHRGCAIPGWVEYAQSRGATLMLSFSQGRFAFCFMPLTAANWPNR